MSFCDNCEDLIVDYPIPQGCTCGKLYYCRPCLISHFDVSSKCPTCDVEMAPQFLLPRESIKHKDHYYFIGMKKERCEECNLCSNATEDLIKCDYKSGGKECFKSYHPSCHPKLSKLSLCQNLDVYGRFYCLFHQVQEGKNNCFIDMESKHRILESSDDELQLQEGGFERSTSTMSNATEGVFFFKELMDAVKLRIATIDYIEEIDENEVRDMTTEELLEFAKRFSFPTSVEVREFKTVSLAGCITRENGLKSRIFKLKKSFKSLQEALDRIEREADAITASYHQIVYYKAKLEETAREKIKKEYEKEKKQKKKKKVKKKKEKKVKKKKEKK